MKPPYVRKSVVLSVKDWLDLVHFVRCDLDNMDSDCPIKKQMARILKTIINRVNSQPK